MSFNEILEDYEDKGYKKEGKRKTKLANYVLLHKEKEGLFSMRARNSCLLIIPLPARAFHIGIRRALSPLFQFWYIGQISILHGS